MTPLVPGASMTRPLRCTHQQFRPVPAKQASASMEILLTAEWAAGDHFCTLLFPRNGVVGCRRESGATRTDCRAGASPSVKAPPILAPTSQLAALLLQAQHNTHSTPPTFNTTPAPNTMGLCFSCLGCNGLPPPPNLAPPGNQYTCPGNQHSGRNLGREFSHDGADTRCLQLQA
jgi:hypothetical protein